MRKYLPQVVQQLIAPSVQMQTSIFSISRILNKRMMLKECKKLWGYHNEDDIDRQIAASYHGLQQAIKTGNSAMALRHLSLNLYDQYTANPSSLKIQDSVSDISILDCARSKNESKGFQWFHMEIVIKHFTVKHYYQLQRRIYNQNYRFQNLLPRKWYFSKFPKQK